MRYEHNPHFPLHHLAPHDPAAVDFRAFYPYTPNEVKHRRRTTSSQLKVLETIFRVDTKPNATLRNDLAAQLGMTARGVQVWFQNRRAKEKNKANKKSQTTASGLATGSAAGSSTESSTNNPDLGLKDEDETDIASPPATPGEDQSEELLNVDSHTNPQLNSPSPALGSPPKLHVLTNPSLRPSSAGSWKPTQSVETPPDSAVFPSRLSLADIHSQRRGSLPANAFFHPYSTSTSTHAPRSIDAWGPLARRRSVDTSLQRLVMHPYAQLALARNGALFGPRSPSLPHVARQQSLPGRKPLPQSRRPILPHHPPPSDYLDMRRASMDPRTLMPSRADGLSPSSHRPLHSIRASLPDTTLYATARRYASPIPGPLPAPNFTFGAATVNSPTSADDEPPSPDLSSYSFPPRDDVAEDDDVMSSISFEALSRFGSAVSIATSESSVFSTAGFYDIGSAPGELAPGQERRGSCGSAHHALVPSVTAGLDGAIPPLQCPAPVRSDGYFDENSTCRVLAPAVNLDLQTHPDDISPTTPFSSPASTASPDDTPAIQSSTPPANAPVSNVNELASAFHTSSGKPGCIIGGSLSPNNSELSKQQEQQSLGHTLSPTQTPPSDQRQLTPGPKAAAPKADSLSIFDDSSGSRVRVAASTLSNDHSVTPVVLPDHEIAAQSMDQRLKALPSGHEIPPAPSRDPTSGQGDYAAQYVDLMDGYGFGVSLAVLDNDSTTHIIGQCEQRPSVAGVDAMASIGANVGVDDFSTAVVASIPYTSGPGASGIAMNQPHFEINYGV